MAPRHKRGTPGKLKGTLNYALEMCDKTQVLTVISKTNLDGKAGCEILNLIHKHKKMKRCLTPLQGAVALGHLDVCKQLVEEGALMSISSSNIAHPLCLALEKGHYEIAIFLIDSGVGSKLLLEDKQPLQYAIFNDECPLDVVKYIIDAGFPVNDVVDLNTGETALHTAVASNRIDVVEYLLSLKGVNPNIRDDKGLTPLHYAVVKNYPSLVSLLIDAGSKIDDGFKVKDQTPLLYSITEGNYEMVKILLDKGADIHRVSSFQDRTITPLHCAVLKCELKITKLLLENGAEINKVASPLNETALHLAIRPLCIHKKTKIASDCIVELLINEGANLDAVTKLGWTPLMMAAKSKNIDAAKILIMNGANVNSVIETSETSSLVFHHIARTFNYDLIKLCLENGADYMSKDSDGIYPCQMAVISLMVDNITQRSNCLQTNSIQSVNSIQSEKMITSVIQLFWRYGFQFDLTLDIDWVKPGVCGYPENVKMMVLFQKMLLHGVEELKHPIVKAAMSKGATVHFFLKNKSTPIHFIASKGGEYVLKKFLNKGVNVNCLNKKGETPLHLAAKAGHVNCCRLLLEHGAVFNPKSKKMRKTPLELAKQHNHTKVVTLLTNIDKCFKAEMDFTLEPEAYLSKLCVMNCCHRDGDTLLARSIKLGMKNVSKFLMERRLEYEE